MKVLITGCRGNLAKTFMSKYSQEYRFVGTCRNKDLKENEVFWDIGETDLELYGEVDVVIHYAAFSKPYGCEQNPEKAFAVNCTGTKELLEWAKEHGVKKFVYISTGSVYGLSNEKHKEDDKLDPSGIYGSTKRMGEELCKDYSNDFQVIIARPFFPYGPETSKGRLIDMFIGRIKEGKELTLNKESKPRMNPIFVDDFNEALNSLILKVEDDYSVYNLAGNDSVSIKQLIELIGKILEKEVKLKQTENEAYDLVGDISKLKILFTPKYSLEEGLKVTVDKWVE